MGRHKKVVMDQLAIDSTNAIKAGMSYAEDLPRLRKCVRCVLQKILWIVLCDHWEKATSLGTE